MTTLISTSTDAQVAGALDGLAAAAEQARDDARSRALLAVVVQRLEDAAGAGVGDTCGDPLVVLQRRFGRAHARLAARPGGHLEADFLHGLVRALQPGAQAGGPVPGVRPAPAAALAGC